jgi:methionyl-tRNA formyltransferase
VLRVVFFGSAGDYSAAHLCAIAEVHRVVGFFCALQSRGARGVAGRLLRSAGLRSDPCSLVARRHGIPRWFTDRSATGVAERMSSLAPEVICIAGYPWLLPASVWRQPPLGAVNSHGSLLPRHRGILPLFWIYYHDDRETGVTVHRVSEYADAGDVICQDAFPLARGFPVEQLSALNAERGSRMLVEALDAVSAGRSGISQDEARSTRAPMVCPGRAMVDFAWDVERVWHFLAGLFPWFVEPLRDPDGTPVGYGAVLGYERARHGQTPGTVRRAGAGWHLCCEGGVVSVGPAGSGRSRHA